MDNSKVYLRANGDMLKEIRGQNVCLLGKCVKSTPDGTSFEISTCDKKTVLCKTKIPIRDALSDLDERGNINCVNYATFEQGQIDNFDMDLYNETIQMIYQIPKHYVQATQ